MAARGDAAGPPDPNTIDSWIAVHADNTATVYLGKGEFGQGNTTGLLQIAGEELDLDMSQLRSVRLDTNITPNQGATTSSSSIHRGGPQVRAAAAEARQALLALASTRLGVQTGSLTVSKGVVSIDGNRRRRSATARCSATSRSTSSSPARAAEADQPVQARRHAGAARRYSGQVTESTSTCSRCACPTCCTAASCGRAGRAPMATAPSRLSIDESSIAGIPAPGSCAKATSSAWSRREWDAVKAARALKVTWKESAALPGNADLFDRMRAAKTTDTVIADWGDAAKAFAGPRMWRPRATAARTSRTPRSPPIARSPMSARTAPW